MKKLLAIFITILIIDIIFFGYLLIILGEIKIANKNLDKRIYFLEETISPGYYGEIK